MELFRTISLPNSGSISTLEAAGTRPSYQSFSYVVSPHAATSLYPGHWQYPDKFDPDRFKNIPNSHQVDEAKCEQMGFSRCPFDRTAFKVSDGRNAAIHNSGFGTVYPIVDGKPLPVCDYAGFAPFGFGYRRCPAEQFTIQVFEDFLRKAWKSRIEFQKLRIAKSTVAWRSDLPWSSKRRRRRVHQRDSNPTVRPMRVRGIKFSRASEWALRLFR